MEHLPYGFTTGSSSLDVHGSWSLGGGADGTPSSSALNRHTLDDYLSSAVHDSCEGTGEPELFGMYGVEEEWAMGIVELSPLPV
jgi:hypothetical protein